MRILRTLAVTATIIGWTAGLHAQTVEQILQKTRDTYAALSVYRDSGTIVSEYGQEPKPAASKHRFTTAFRRAPRAFVFEFYKDGGDRFVVWGDPDAFHTWWKTTGAQYDFANPNNVAAISGSAPSTVGASLKIPSLLYGKSALAAVLLSFQDPVLDGNETINGRKCHRIVGRASDTYAATGKEVNIHRILVWIDETSFFVRQVREEWKPLPGTVQRVTTIYEPQTGGSIEEGALKFSPPASR